MIDQQIKEHVVRQVDAVAGAQGDYAEVVRRGRRRRTAQRGALVSAVVLAVVGLVGIATHAPSPPAADLNPETNADRVITVNPGGGPGDLAETLAGRMPSVAVEGSASHIGSVETLEGRFDLVTFTAVGEDLVQPDEPAACMGATRGAATSVESRFFVNSCYPTDEVRILSRFWGRGDFYWILDRMPTDTTVVMVTTSRGQTIEVSTSAYVFATWPLGWGPPETLTAYNAEGAATGSIDYTQ